MSLENTIRNSIEALNRHDAAGCAAWFAADAVANDPQYDQPLKGREAIQRDLEDFFKSFPDVRAEITSLIVNGDTAALETTMTGTNKGPLVVPSGELPATGKHLQIRVAVFSRGGAEDRIVEQRRYFDLAGMMAQLGVA